MKKEFLFTRQSHFRLWENIYHQFGKFVANHDEPIVEQPILRAFASFKAKGKADEIDEAKTGYLIILITL